MAKTECSTYNRPVLKGYGFEKGVVYLYQPRCKTWKCPYCATMNKLTWIATISEGITTYQNGGIGKWRFITVTSHEKNRTMSSSCYVWPKAWAKLSSRMRYHYRGIKYVLLPEAHKDGTLHIHSLASHGMTTRFLKDHGRSCGLGYMNEAKELNSGKQSVPYVTKYLGKSIADEKWPPRFRRIRTSQKWPELEDQAGFDAPLIEWEYLSTYPSDGLDYLAEGIRKSTGFDTVILR